jgi:ABC-type transport system involved in cytochrome c biogenesis permease subunit
MSRFGQWILPAVVAMSALTCIAWAMTPAEDPVDGMHLIEFGRLPISDRGRTKPIDAMARTDLMVLTGKQEFYDEQGKKHSAVEWMLDALTSLPPFKNPAASEHKVFRIENDQVLSLLDLKPRPGSYRYSIDEMRGKWPELQAALQRSGDKKDQDKFDQKLHELGEHLELYIKLASMDSPLLLDPAHPEDPRPLREVVAKWSENARAEKEEGADVAALADSMPPFLKLLLAYQSDKPDKAADFNKEVAAYRQQLETTLPVETHKAAFEANFNEFAPFYLCTFFYVGIFLLTCAFWIVKVATGFGRGVSGDPIGLNLAALVLAGITIVVHTGAFIARMYIMDRQFVFITNLYGTAIFMGWICILLGVAVELIFRNGLGTFVAAVAGFTTMIIAQYLAVGEDTMEMMRAVLDTNFWLATHVTTVNIGYDGTVFAGLLGAVFVVWGAFTHWQNKTGVQVIGYIIYGILCFATLFSFTGTVLGGIWADQSWGRFWGWDPKENGALLIVIWNALILHARWGGMVKQRGMAVLALMGNIIVIWSWWGVNMLGVGLHAYSNANPEMLMWVNIGVAAHLVFIAIGLTPRSLWLSYDAQQAIPLPPPSAPNGRPRGRGRTDIRPEPA